MRASWIDVGEARQVFQRQRLVGEQRGDHQRQRRVLGAGNRNHAVELSPAANLNAIHSPVLPTPRNQSNNPAPARDHRIASSLAGLGASGAVSGPASPATDPVSAARERLLGLPPLQILPERSGEAGLPSIPCRAPGVVRGHERPSTSAPDRISSPVDGLIGPTRPVGQVQRRRNGWIFSAHPAFSIRLAAAARASRVICAPASMRAISSRRSPALSRATLVDRRARPRRRRS